MLRRRSATSRPRPTSTRSTDDADLREQLDLDSMDFLNFVDRRCTSATGIDVPERDYPKLATLAGCVAYLSGAAAA